MKSFYGGKREFRSVEGYESKWRHRNILFTPVPDLDLAGQPVSAYTFNLDNPLNGKKENEHDEKSRNFILYNDLYDEEKVNEVAPYRYIKDRLSDIYLDIIMNAARWHRMVNNNNNIDLQQLKLSRFPANTNANKIFLKNLINAIPNMSESDKKFFRTFVSVGNTTGKTDIPLDDLEISKLDSYYATINYINFYSALPEVPLGEIGGFNKNEIKNIYINVYNGTDRYFIPPPGREFLSMFNYVSFMEKIMDSGLPSKVPDDYVRKLFSEDDLTKIITEIGVIKEIWFRDADGDLAYKDNSGNSIKLNDKEKKRVIQKFFNVSRDNCMGTYFMDKSKCNKFIFECINHTGTDGNLDKCVQYITDANNFPKDLKKEVQKVQPRRAISFLRALGYKIITVGHIDKIQNWNEWMTEVVEQSGLSSSDIEKIAQNDNLKRLLTYFVEYINGNPALLNKNYDSTKQRVKSSDECPYGWIKRLGGPISRNMKSVKNVSDSSNNLFQLLFNNITKPKQVTKQNLFGNNSLGSLDFLGSLSPLLLMGTSLIGGSQKITFPYFNKDTIRQMNGGNLLLNILPGNFHQQDDNSNINLFYKHIDSIVQHQRNRNINIFSDAEVNEIKDLIKKLDNLIKRIQAKMVKLELSTHIIDSGLPGAERLIPLNEKIMNKIVKDVNTVYNGEYSIKNVLNSGIKAMIEEEFGSINLNSKPITSIY